MLIWTTHLSSYLKKEWLSSAYLKRTNVIWMKSWRTFSEPSKFGAWEKGKTPLEKKSCTGVASIDSLKNVDKLKGPEERIQTESSGSCRIPNESLSEKRLCLTKMTKNYISTCNTNEETKGWVRHASWSTMEFQSNLFLPKEDYDHCFRGWPGCPQLNIPWRLAS